MTAAAGVEVSISGCRFRGGIRAGDVAVDERAPQAMLLTAAACLATRIKAGDRFALTGAETRLGRHPDSEIMLDDITVSRRHATIERTGEGYVVSDVGSLNGTYVNQQRIDRAVLHHGDELQVGKFRLVLFEQADG